jgi:rRNA-processing protein FCF1
MQIILDTNFILSSLEQKIDLFEQIDLLFPGVELVVPRQVILELETLRNRKELKIIERDAASLALQLLGRKKVKVLDLSGPADRVIVNYVLGNEKVIMASLDGGMRKHVKGKAKMLSIRNRKRIVVV